MTSASSDTTAAVWYAADSSRKTAATLWFEGNLVCIKNENGERRMAHIAEVEISPRLANVPRRLTFTDGVSLSVADNDFIDEQLTATRRGSGGFLHRLEKSWSWLLLLLILGGAVVYATATVGVPAVARVAAAGIAHDQLSRLTQAAYDGILEYDILRDSRLPPSQWRRAEALFNDVISDYPPSGYDFRLKIHRFIFEEEAEDDQTTEEDTSAGAVGEAGGETENDKATEEDTAEDFGLANAFAFPDGLIVATDALLTTLNDDEITAVFAHELGHVHYRHGVQGIIQAAGLGALMTFIFGDISTVLLASSFLLELKYSREFEQEADCYSFVYLKKRGLPSSLLRESLRKLEATYSPAADADTAESVNSESEEAQILRKALILLSTHPHTEERTALHCPS